MKLFPLCLVLLGLQAPIPLQEERHDNINQLLRELKSDEVSSRNAAAARLKTLGSKIIPELLKLQDDADPEVAARVRSLIRVIPIVEQLPANLIRTNPGIDERLAQSDDYGWTTILLELARKDSTSASLFPPVTEEDLVSLFPRAIRGAKSQTDKISLVRTAAHTSWRIKKAGSLIVAFLKDPDPKVRIAALETLGKLEYKSDNGAIRKLLLDKDDTVRVAAINAVADIGAKDSEPDLVSFLSESSEHIRKWSAYSLANLGGSEAVTPLRRLLKDSSNEVIAAAAYALGKLRAREAIQQLSELLDHKEPQVVIAAINALEECSVAEAVPKIRPLLRSDNRQVRAHAVLALGQLGDTHSSAGIGLLLKDDSRLCRQYSLASLRMLGARDHADRVAECLKDLDPYVRGEAARALAVLREKGQVDGLFDLLTASLDHASRHAAEAIADLNGEKLVDGIVMLLKAKDSNKQELALYALDQLGRKETIDHFVRFLGIREFQYQIISSLGVLGSDTLQPLLEPYLESPEAELRGVAAEALGRLNLTASIPKMRKLLKDPHARVRAVAASALCQLGVGEGAAVLLECAEQTPEIKLFSLNSLRQPEHWKRLGREPLNRPVTGIGFEAFEHLVKAVGLKPELPECSTSRELYWKRVPLRIGSRGGATRATIAFGELVAQGPFDIIIEAQSIRLVGQQDALVFWKAWSKSNEEKPR